jgi:hypothetical protein
MSDEPLNADAIKLAIGQEIYKALEKLGAPVELLSVVGSYGDTLPDKHVLLYLRAYNERGSYWNEVVCEVGKPSPVVRPLP